MTIAEKRRLLAVENDALRRSSSMFRRQRIRNERIKEIIKMQDSVCDDILKKTIN